MKKIYLHRLDISENGLPMPFDGNNLFHYLTLYTLFFDQVVLQSSAPMKRRDLSFFIRTYPEMFTPIDSLPPLISLPLDKPSDMYAGYENSRHSILRKSKNYKSNPEFLAYENTDSKSIALFMDSIISKSDIFKTEKNIDSVFRKQLCDFSSPVLHSTLETQQFFNIKNIMQDHALKEEICQTFIIKNRIKAKYLLPASIQNTLNAGIRSLYFEANRISNNCISNTYHTTFSSINMFSHLIGLDFIFQGILFPDGFLIRKIKENQDFQSLIDIFHKTEGSILTNISKRYHQYAKKSKFFHSPAFQYNINAGLLDYNFPKYRREFLEFLTDTNSKGAKQLYEK